MKKLSRVGKPLYSCLILSHRCFFQCQMCLNWNTPPNADRLCFDDCKRFIDGLSEFIDYSLDINIMGGEPLMIDWFLPLCNYIYEKGFTSIISTNGYLIDNEMAKEIIDSHLEVLAFSLDGMKAETHDSIRGMKGAYSRIMDAIGYLKEYRKDKPKVVILTLILEKNLEELIELVNWVQKTDIVGEISFLALQDPGLVDKKENWFQQPEYKQLWPQDFDKLINVIDSLISLKRKGYKIYNPFSQLEAFKEYYRDPERFLQETPHRIYDYIIDLDPTGEIFLSGHLLGSIRDNISLEELWFSEKANKIRQEIDLYGCVNSRAKVINYICAFQDDNKQVNSNGQSKYQAERYAQLGFFYQKKGKYDIAITQFKKALELNPNNAKLHLGVAYNYLKSKDYKAALCEYQEAFRLDPTSCKEATLDYKEALRRVREVYGE